MSKQVNTSIDFFKLLHYIICCTTYKLFVNIKVKNMALLNLVTAPDNRLSHKSVTVTNHDVNTRALMDDMLATMYYNKGVGLAAVQVGVLQRIIVIDMQDLVNPDEIARQEGFYPLFLVNPEIVKVSQDKIGANEGCLSLPNQTIELARPSSLMIKYQDYNNNNVTLEADGWLARAIQHEIDHLEGKLLVDYLSNLKKQFAIKKLAKIKNAQEL